MIYRGLIVIVLFSTLIYAQPSWILNPNLSEYITGIGSSDEPNLLLRERVAVATARANLIESIKVEIQSSTKMNISVSNDDNLKKEFIQTIEQKAQQILKGSFIKEKYTDKNGVLYILVVIKKGTNK